MNAKQLKRPVCILTVHQREFFLDGGGIDKWTVQHWNSQKVDHQQLFEIFGQERGPILPKWTTERCGKYRRVEDLDGNNKIKCNMCHIVVHQEFHGFEVSYHNVDTKERALWILTIPCNSCLKVCVICEHLQGSDNLCSKCTTNFHVLRALQAVYHMALIEFDSWLNHISRYLSALTQTDMGAILSLRFRPVRVDIFPPHTVVFSNAHVAENVTFDIALVKWLLIYSLQRIDQEDKEDTLLVKATPNIYPSLNKFAAMISILFYPNLEDKVLIQDGGIVVNQVDFVRAYVLQVVNGADLDGIIGPSKILESFIWDPGPIINQLNRIRD
ncbi:hypothetical protein KY285_010699 [Solanum tuberosum]|nr:hypothetical protein KY289_011277 [Solanum tuberosum]KAH0734992.1 hypothetical protein KY285_010699 [Solanum tuberosum]